MSLNVKFEMVIFTAALSILRYFKRKILISSICLMMFDDICINMRRLRDINAPLIYLIFILA